MDLYRSYLSQIEEVLKKYNGTKFAGTGLLFAGEELFDTEELK